MQSTGFNRVWRRAVRLINNTKSLSLSHITVSASEIIFKDYSWWPAVTFIIWGFTKPVIWLFSCPGKMMIIVNASLCHLGAMVENSFSYLRSWAPSSLCSYKTMMKASLIENPWKTSQFSSSSGSVGQALCTTLTSCGWRQTLHFLC